MTFVVPKYSRAQVTRAGELLITPNVDVLDSIWADVVLTNWRASHNYPINTFQATLRQKLKGIDPHATVAQRLKRTPSIISKLQRFHGMQLARMQDIGGLRAIVSSVRDVRKLENAYRKSRFAHKLVSSKDYIAHPKADGYRSVHLVYKYRNEQVPAYDGLQLELQFRSRLQHAWATAVETMSTFLGEALKSGQGDPAWRAFFEVSSAAIAHIERSPPVPGYENLSRQATFEKVAGAEAKLHVLDKLRGFSIAADKITTEKGQGSYHLIVLDSLAKSVSIRPYAMTRLEQANIDYTELEKRTQAGEPIEAVLVSAGPIEALKKAYPNYFLDTHAFIVQIERVIEEARRPRVERLTRRRRRIVARRAAP